MTEQYSDIKASIRTKLQQLVLLDHSDDEALKTVSTDIVDLFEANPGMLRQDASIVHDYIRFELNHLSLLNYGLGEVYDTFIPDLCSRDPEARKTISESIVSMMESLPFHEFGWDQLGTCLDYIDFVALYQPQAITQDLTDKLEITRKTLSIGAQDPEKIIDIREQEKLFELLKKSASMKGFHSERSFHDIQNEKIKGFLVIINRAILRAQQSRSQSPQGPQEPENN